MPKPLSLLLALLLIALSAVAAAFGVAGIYRNEAASLIQQWDWPEDEPGPTAGAWEQVQRYLWLANRLAPLDAQILDDLGELYELRADEAPDSEDGSDADRERALGLYRQALALRPAWPYTWADVALLKLTQKHIDAEFALALQRALELGPWQSPVQASIASGGLAVWDKLPEWLQTDVEQAVARGLSSGSRFMPGVARRYGLIAADG